MDSDVLVKIVLVAPEIPGNTGSIGRTCVALNCELILIRPIAFDISEKAVRRAGLDYWKYVRLKVYDNFEHFLESESPDVKQLYFFSRFAKNNYYEIKYKWGDYLIFGQETKGLPQELLLKYEDQTVVIPTRSEQIRSLNLSNAATAVALEAQRSILYY